MFIDSWGRESKTKEEAEQKILQGFRESDDYYETLSENMNIPTEYFMWIVKNHWADFKRTFAKDIKKAEHDWVDFYLNFELFDTEESDPEAYYLCD